MNFISAFLALLAILNSVLVIGLLIMWLKGADSIAFPGLGIIVATPLIVLLLLILEVVIVILVIAMRATV